ncbi:dethiobiotin synthase [Rhodococcoides yunnanense]|uniref:dethiobiotin synthase n=1 Tax=Rhodococcoides yunnanense TaxID=278209 RepID=UPI0022B16FCC|nr:dethiobiotin synthase [Rhodococcus yunnanensis]MCZ4278872.1 dethiobiotin synthase [Rhodococcus yunnanensis]
MTMLVVTGTSTDVGKTIVTAALAAAAMKMGATVAVAKPAQTGVADGEPGDIAEIQRLSGVVDVRESARYPDPLAPDVAARRASMPLLTLQTVLDDIRSLTADLVLVEGAGGLLVRLGEDGFTLVDVARELDAPVVVVCSAGLGTLNHAALTTLALASAGLACAGLIIGSWPAEPDLAARTNLDQLSVVTGAPLIGRLPEGAGTMTRAEFIAAAPSWLDRQAMKGILSAW